MAHTSLLLLLIIGLAEADDVILRPLKQGAEEVALIVIQGSLIKPDQYTPLAQSVQNSSNYSLWVGIPQFDGDMAVPVDPSEGIARILGAMRDGGMSAATTVFFAGHSIGGAALQDYVNNEAKDAPGLILLGSFLRRWYRNVTYPVPTITIGGELDGLARVTRIMEEYYHRVLHSTEEQKIASASFPVVVVEGLSHMQFASGDPPALVKDRDLQPEISYEEAHAIVGSLVASFIAVRLGDASQQMAIDRALTTTWAFVQPLVVAYYEEGFYNFLPPCYNDPPSASCTTGCPWTEVAQVIMSGLNESTVMVTDAFHPVSQLFPEYHHPKIINSCTGGDSSGCFLNETSVTENKYDDLDKVDDGLAPTSAEEIRAKMNSRQAVWEAVGMQNVNFDVSDGPSICKYTNEAAYNWTVSNSIAPKTLARFQKYGEPLVMGEDKGSYIFPEWALLPLEYTEMKDDAENMYVLVSSPMMKVPTDFVVKLLAGFHFCKLLSPGRVAEWLYVDGLREHYSLANVH